MEDRNGGSPIPGVEVRVDPLTSEIQYRGRNVMMGYLKQAEETLNTVDEEGLDAHGRPGIVGRGRFPEGDGSSEGADRDGGRREHLACDH